MAIKVGGTTVIDDSRALQNVSGADTTTKDSLGLADSAWTIGTSTSNSTVSPAQVKAAIETHAPSGPFTSNNQINAGGASSVDFDVTGFDGLRFFLGVTNSGGFDRTITVNVSDGTFGTNQTLITVPSSSERTLSGYWNESTGLVEAVSQAGYHSATVTKTSSITTFRFSGTADLTFGVHIMPDGGAA